MTSTAEAPGRAAEIEQLDTTPVLRDLSLALQRRKISRGGYTYGRHLVREYLNTNPEHRAFCGCFPAAETVVSSMMEAGFSASLRSVSRWKGELEQAGIICKGPRFWHKSDNLEFQALADNRLYRWGLERLYERLGEGGSPTLARGGRQLWRGGVANFGDQTPGSKESPIRRNPLEGGERRAEPAARAAGSRGEATHRPPQNRRIRDASEPQEDPGLNWSEFDLTHMGELLAVLQEESGKRHIGGDAKGYLFDERSDEGDRARLEELLTLEDERIRGGARRLATDPQWRVGHRMQTVRLWLEQAKRWVRGPQDWGEGERLWYAFLWSLFDGSSPAPAPASFQGRLNQGYAQVSYPIVKFLRAELAKLLSNGYSEGAPEPVELPEPPAGDAPAYDRELWAYQVLQRLAAEEACPPDPRLMRGEDWGRVAAYYGVSEAVGEELAEYAAHLEAEIPEQPRDLAHLQANQRRDRCLAHAIQLRMQRLVGEARPDVHWFEVEVPDGYDDWAVEHAGVFEGPGAIVQAEASEDAGETTVEVGGDATVTEPLEDLAELDQVERGKDAKCLQEGVFGDVTGESVGRFQPIGGASSGISAVCEARAKEGDEDPPLFAALSEREIIERIREVNIGLVEVLDAGGDSAVLQEGQRLLAELRASLDYVRQADPGAARSQDFSDPFGGGELLGNQQVPALDQAGGPAQPALEVVGSLGPVGMEPLEHPVVDEELLLPQLQEVADLGGDRGVVEQQGVVDDGLEVEAIDRVNGAPDLLPAAGQVGSVQDVDEGALKGGDMNRHVAAGVVHLDAGALLALVSQRLGVRDDPVGLTLEAEGADLVGGEHQRLEVDRVGRSEELERGVVADHGVGGELGGQEVVIDPVGLGAGAGTDGGVQAPANPDEVADSHVVDEQGLDGAGAALALAGQVIDQVGLGEDGVPEEEGSQVHLMITRKTEQKLVCFEEYHQTERLERPKLITWLLGGEKGAVGPAQRVASPVRNASRSLSSPSGWCGLGPR